MKSKVQVFRATWLQLGIIFLFFVSFYFYFYFYFFFWGEGGRRSIEMGNMGGEGNHLIADTSNGACMKLGAWDY